MSQTDPKRNVVLMVGATGMLLPAVRRLASLGKRILVVARRPAPAEGLPGVIGVSGRWEQPDNLAGAVAVAMRSHELAAPSETVLWVHSPHRTRVGREIARLLAPGSVVVELFSASGHSSSEDPPAHFAEHFSYRAVVLGYMPESHGGRRWLTNAEISAASIRALSDPTAVQVAGRIDG